MTNASPKFEINITAYNGQYHAKKIVYQYDLESTISRILTDMYYGIHKLEVKRVYEESHG